MGRALAGCISGSAQRRSLSALWREYCKQAWSTLWQSLKPVLHRPADLVCPALQQAAFAAYQKGRGLQEVALILVCSSAVALAYNVVHSLAIRRLSSTGCAVLGEIKVLALLVTSAILFGEASGAAACNLSVNPAAHVHCLAFSVNRSALSCYHRIPHMCRQEIALSFCKCLLYASPLSCFRPCCQLLTALGGMRCR